MRPKQFVTAAITPAVLILALLAFSVLHFRNDVALAVQHDQLYLGSVTYNTGLFGVSFARDEGGNRPLITYGQDNALRYAEWNSYLVIDGQVYPLWDQSHGYSFDPQRKQIFSTVSGADWQLVQVTSLVGSHVDVTYDFVTKTHGVSSAYGGPHQITLVLTHLHNYWINPTVTGTVFEAGITTLYQDQDAVLGQVQQGTGGAPLQTPDVAVRPSWTMQLRAQPAAGVQGSLQLGAMGSSGNPIKGTGETWASQLTASYTLTNPDINVLVPLATETITLTQAQS
jgi:hypothetical protein